MCLHLADELTAESVDNTSDGGLLALADEVEVKHALDGLGLHAAVKVLSALHDLRAVELAIGSCAMDMCSFSQPLRGDSLDETSRLGVEELVVGLRSVCSAGRSEACDVVVGGKALAVGHSSRSHCVYGF